VDIPTAADQWGDVIFTLAWPGQDGQERWLGRNIDVTLVEPPASTEV